MNFNKALIALALGYALAATASEDPVELPQNLSCGIGSKTYPTPETLRALRMREVRAGSKVRWTNPDDCNDTGMYKVVRVHTELGCILDGYTMVTLLNGAGKHSEVLARELS